MVGYFLTIINSVILKLSNVKLKGNITVRGLLIIKNKGSIDFGDGIIINSSSFRNVIGGDTRTSIVVKKGAVLSIGNNVRISNSAIYANTEIIIEDNVMIGGSCRIWDSDFHPIDPIERKLNPNNNYVCKPIRIGKNAFVGGGSMILKNVVIGENSVIGAGSVVTKNIPPNQIWAGNPAMFIKDIKR